MVLAPWELDSTRLMKKEGTSALWLVFISSSWTLALTTFFFFSCSSLCPQLQPPPHLFLDMHFDSVFPRPHLKLPTFLVLFLLLLICTCWLSSGGCISGERRTINELTNQAFFKCLWGQTPCQASKGIQVLAPRTQWGCWHEADLYLLFREGCKMGVILFQFHFYSLYFSN